jgi:hypothetical protein
VEVGLVRPGQRVDAFVRTGEAIAVEISYCLCPLSAKRLALLEEHPKLVHELTEDAVPDMVDLGSNGFALDGILLFAERNSAIRDAVFAQTGRRLGEPGDSMRVHTAARVVEVHDALNALPADVIARHYEDARKAIPQLERGPASIARFTQLFEQLRAVYAKTATSGHGMLTFLV